MKLTFILLVSLALFAGSDGRRKRHRHHHGHRRQKICKLKTVCKAVEEMEKMLKTQADQVVAQGQQMQYRIDAAEAKMEDIQNVGRQLTELLTEQGNKITEQGAALSESGGSLIDQVTTEGAKLSDKIDSQGAKIIELQNEGAKLNDQLGAQDLKMAAIEAEGAKTLDRVAGTEKQIESKMNAQISKWKTKLPLPDGTYGEVEAAQAKITEKLGSHDQKMQMVATQALAIKERVQQSTKMVTDMGDSTMKVAATIDANDKDLGRSEQAAKSMTGRAEENDAKMTATQTKAETAFAAVQAAGLKAGQVWSAQGRRKMKIRAQEEKLMAIKAQSDASDAALKAQSQKLKAVQTEITARKARRKGLKFRRRGRGGR